MNGVDYVIIAIIAISALVGLARGLVREILSLGVWIAALVIAWIFHRDLADLLVTQLSQPSLRIAVAFAALVFVVLLVGAILGAILSAFVEKAGLTGLDRLLGMLFGTARGAVIVAMAVFLVALTPLPQDVWWQESQLIGGFQATANRMLALVPEGIQTRLRQL